MHRVASFMAWAAVAQVANGTQAWSTRIQIQWVCVHSTNHKGDSGPRPIWQDPPVCSSKTAWTSPPPTEGEPPTIDAMPHLRNWSNLGRSSSILKAKKRYLMPSGIKLARMKKTWIEVGGFEFLHKDRGWFQRGDSWPCLKFSGPKFISMFIEWVPTATAPF